MVDPRVYPRKADVELADVSAGSVPSTRPNTATG